MDMRRYIVALALLGAGTAYAAPEAGAVAQPIEQPPIEAQWQRHEVDFNFFGNSVEQHIYYDCDAVQAKLEKLLRLAGARRDVKVRTYGCAVGPERVSNIIRADLVFQSPTLKPQNLSTTASETPRTAAAHWTPVKLRLGWTRGFDSGDCMLVDQFRRQVLKYFDLRNITADLPCTTSSALPRGRSSLAFEALTATPVAEEESIEFEKQPKKHDDKVKSERT